MWTSFRFTALAALVLLCASAMPARADATLFGRPRVDLTIAGQKAFIVFPTKPAKDNSKPWIWYAPTFIDQHPDNSHTWMAEQLLDAGFAICGIEVGESYGSPTGRAIYSRFYDHLTQQLRFDDKPCLLAQSRGGLMLLTWAAENPARVGRIAGIYPVCNIESYPGIEKASAAYNISTELFATELDQHNPIALTDPIAENEIPVLFVHGDSDTVVPVELNSAEYVERCNENGGKAKLILVKGKGHEVCPDFFQNRELTDFLLSHADNAIQEPGTP